VLYDSTLFGFKNMSNYYIVNKNQYKILRNNIPKLKIPIKRGDYATSSIFLNKKELKWARKFNIVELGGIDDDKINYNFLKKQGVLSIPFHVGYDWMPSFYYYTSGQNRNFIKWIYKNKNKTTLNPKGPYLHCKENHYDWCEDYYYNLGDKKVFDARIDDLIQNMKRTGFNGLFFDWASGGYILEKEYESIYKNFRKLNPGKDYFSLVGNFYKKLKKLDILVVTNQAFRKEKYLLPFVTYDMTESYITTDVNIDRKIQIQGKGWVEKIPTTNYYPINKNSNSLKDSLYYINLLTNYKKKYKKYGFKNFIYLNYLAPNFKKIFDSASVYRMEKPKNGIYFSYAMAKLTDNIVYAEVPYNRKLERDDVYFYDLGKPLSKSYGKVSVIDGYIRFYSHGFVLVSSAHKKDIYLKVTSSFVPEIRHIYDAYDKIWLKNINNSTVVKLHFQKNIFSKKMLPLGRVYLYTK
jgi:hypothetical protein